MCLFLNWNKSGHEQFFDMSSLYWAQYFRGAGGQNFHFRHHEHAGTSDYTYRIHMFLRGYSEKIN